MKSSLPSAAGLLLASGLLLTGCASAPTLEESWPDVRKKIVDAQSLRLQMEGVANAEDGVAGSPSSEIQSANADLAGATDGSHLKGTMAMDMGETTMDMEVLRLQDESFMKMQAEGEDAPPEMAMFSEIVGDRWMLMPEENAEDLSLKDMMDEMEKDLPAEDAFDGKDLKPEKVELDGQEYLKYTLPEEAKDFARVMYVDPEDDVLYRLEGTNPDDAAADATVTFTEWDAVQPPERPADDQIFDMKQLQGLAG